MSCHLQKDSASAEFVSGLQQCSNALRRTQTLLSKKKIRQKLLTLLTSLGFFHLFQDLSQKVQEILEGIFLYRPYYYRL